MLPVEGNRNVETEAASNGPEVEAVAPKVAAVEDVVGTPPVMKNPGSGKKTPSTTSRRTKKKERARKGKQVRIKRGNMMQITLSNEQRTTIPTEWPNSAPFYGTIKGGNSQTSWAIDIDIFPVGNKRIENVKGGRLHVLRQGEDEPLFDPDAALWKMMRSRRKTRTRNLGRKVLSSLMHLTQTRRKL